MTQLIREIANRYMDAKCSAKAWEAVRNMAKTRIITDEEWIWFSSNCGTMIYDYEEQKVYTINDDGSMKFAKRYQ